MEYTFTQTRELWNSWLLAVYTRTGDGRKEVWYTCIKGCLLLLCAVLIVFLLDKTYALELLGVAVVGVLIKSKCRPFAWVVGRMAMKHARPNGFPDEVFSDPVTIRLTPEGVSTGNRYERREVQWSAGIRGVCSDELCVFLLGDQVIGCLPRRAFDSSEDLDQIRAWCANMLIIGSESCSPHGRLVSVVNTLGLSFSGFACMAVWVVPVVRILSVPIGVVGLLLGVAGLFFHRGRVASIIAIGLALAALLAEFVLP